MRRESEGMSEGNRLVAAVRMISCFEYYFFVFRFTIRSAA